MLSRLRSRAGRWYDLAKFLPALAVQNYNSSAVDDITGCVRACASACVCSVTKLVASPGRSELQQQRGGRHHWVRVRMGVWMCVCVCVHVCVCIMSLKK